MSRVLMIERCRDCRFWDKWDDRQVCTKKGRTLLYSEFVRGFPFWCPLPEKEEEKSNAKG